VEALLPEQSHVGSEFLSIPFRIPAAQPTPDRTDKALKRQFLAHAPHSMHESISCIIALPC
jgi:hypothetical protein